MDPVRAERRQERDAPLLRQIIVGLRPFAAGLRRRLACLAASAIIGSLCEAVALALAVRVALSLDSVPRRPIDVPIVGVSIGAQRAMLVAAGCAVGALLGHLIIARLAARVGSSVLAKARDRVVGGYLDTGWPTQAMQREGQLQDTVGTLAMQVAQMAQWGANGTAHLITLVVLILLSFTVDATTTLVVLISGILAFACMRPIARSTRRRSRKFVALNSHYTEEVARLTSASMELTAFGVARSAEAGLAAVNVTVRQHHFRARFMWLFGTSLYKDLAIILLIGVIALLAAAREGAVAGIGVVITLIVRSLASAQQVSSAYQWLSDGSPNLDELARRLEALERGKIRVGTRRLKRLDSIELREVGYTYEDGVSALERVSVTIETGEAIGIVGPSGGGKSTLLQLLLRLRLPTAGEILANDINYIEFGRAEWANLIGFVRQEPTLLEGTVADNIRYYRDFDIAQVEAAAVSANVYDDIMRLAHGFETRLGPRGAGLSGGQKQRVAIARALIARPQLLVLDEPTSALDIRSEQLLQDTLAHLKGETTMVIVAHRLKTVGSCDRLMVLEHGRVTALGAPDELFETSAFLARAQEFRT